MTQHARSEVDKALSRTNRFHQDKEAYTPGKDKHKQDGRAAVVGCVGYGSADGGVRECEMAVADGQEA